MYHIPAVQISVVQVKEQKVYSVYTVYLHYVVQKNIR